MYSSEFIFNIPGIREIIMEYKHNLEYVEVKSMTGAGKIYIVEYDYKIKGHHCTCPAFKYYSGNCKHIKKVIREQNKS